MTINYTVGNKNNYYDNTGKRKLNVIEELSSLENSFSKFNIYFQINMTIDLNSSRRNVTKKSKEVIKFATIKYFMIHNYNDRGHMLSCVQFTKNVIKD